MIDLAARIHYKAHFDINAVESSTDLQIEVASIIWQWLQRKYKRKIYFWNWTKFCKFGQFETNEKDVYASTTSFCSDDTSHYWACKISEFQQSVDSYSSEEAHDRVIECAPRTWVTEIGFEQTSIEKATISFVVYFIDKAGFVGSLAAAPDPTTPSIVYRLLSSQMFICKIGDTTLSTYASQIITGTADKLVDLIMNPNRGVPILLMIPKRFYSIDRLIEECPVNPIELMKSVVGNALVFYAQSATLSEEMDYLMSTHYTCRPGQIRLYMPYIDRKNQSDGNRHRYLRDEQIRQLGESQVISIFRRVLSQDIRYYESKEMFRGEDCDELYRKSRQASLRQKFDAAKESASSIQATNKELEELLDMADEENCALRRESDDLRNSVANLKSDNWSLTNQVSRWTQLISDIHGKDEALKNIRSFSSMPHSPHEIADYFRKVFHDSFDLSERGLASLDDCITKGEVLWECFFNMATILVSLYRSGTSTIEASFREKSGGWDIARGEGAETRKDSRLMALRNDVYEGRAIFIEPHVKKGNDDSSPNSVRAYFCFDEVSRRIVVGHVGGHLENYTSRLVK